MKHIEYDKNGLAIKVKTINEEPSKTQQHMMDQCDINKIIAKYQKTGEITHLRNTQGVYADLSEISDFQTSLNNILKANDAFMALSSDIRKRFGNDPAQLVEFLADHKNDEEAVKLGLKTTTKIPNSKTFDEIKQKNQKLKQNDDKKQNTSTDT